DVHIRHQPRAGGDLDLRADDAVGADLGCCGYGCAGIDKGCRVDGHYSGLSASLHMTSASATSAPSTVALPLIFATDALRFSMISSMRSWSPGTTCFRNFAYSTETSSTSLLWRSSMLLRTST